MLFLRLKILWLTLCQFQNQVEIEVSRQCYEVWAVCSMGGVRVVSGQGPVLLRFVRYRIPLGPEMMQS